MPKPQPHTVVGLILAGGEGKRLYPLTRDRAKPAVPFGGRYRIIDFVLSNFVNSGIYQLSVITQYKAGSLMQHLARGWQLSPQMNQYVAPVPPAMNLGPRFFSGSADAVLQNLDVIENANPEHVAVFGADHIYKMDVRQMIDFHVDTEAEATVAVIPVPAQEASGFGLVDVDADFRVVGFREKPPIAPGDTEPKLASMGLYVFRADTLMREIVADAERPNSAHDFGRDILPALVPGGRLMAYDFSKNVIPGMDERERGYWRDIGTIDAYWAASLELVSVAPNFSLYNPGWPIYTAYYPSAPAKFVFSDREHNRVGIATDSMVSEGCIISGGHVDRSILGLRVRVNSFSSVSESILFDDVEVGRNARLRRTIVDKGVEIPAGLTVGYDLEEDRKRFTVSDDGVVVIPKGATLA